MNVDSGVRVNRDVIIRKTDGTEIPAKYQGVHGNTLTAVVNGATKRYQSKDVKRVLKVS